MLLSGPPLPPAPVSTLNDAILALGGRLEVVLTVHRGSEARTFTGPQLLSLARRWRAACRAAGLGPGDRAVLLLPNDERFVAAFLGVLLTGAAPVPLAWPSSLSHRERALAPLRPLVEAADPGLVLTVADAAEGWPCPVVSEPVEEGPEAPDPFDAAVAPEDAAFLQYTSGSMGRPRGAVISHQAAVTCAWSMGTALGMHPDDVGLSWLPLYHDMGLVGAMLCPLLFGFPLHLMDPVEFLLHPGRWLERAAALGATIAAAPDFAWRLCARRVRTSPGDLSHWRVALDGAEPVHRSTLAAFVERFGPDGFPDTALRPSYGLAENTLGVCIYDPTRPAPDLPWEGRAIPSVGGPLPGVQVELRRTDGTPCDEGEAGEILVHSGSLMSGYFRDPAASARSLVDGWLHTGDLGVVHGGQLYVTGRIKDLVIQNGVKFHPYDIERIAADAAHASPNGAAAFAVPGELGEMLVVVVEVPTRRAEDIEKRVRGALVEALGVRAGKVIAVPPGALPRTTSGKLRRPAAAEQFGGVS